MTTRFTLNGRPVSVDDRHAHLLAALRGELGITSAKDGCSPSGQCGCCTVLLDGKAVVSCVTPLGKVAGKEVTTLEGFDGPTRDRLARAFAATGALQCGFCTPGILVRAKALIDQEGPAIDRSVIERRLGAHLCRCTGYVKIIEAIELAASEVPIPEVTLGAGIGKHGSKYESIELALGDRGYIDDLTVEGMLYAALRLTDHARAEVLTINVAAAAAEPGVVAVYTAVDIPGDLRVGLIHKDWPVMIPEGGRTSFTGDVLAVVVADEVGIARRAADLIEVSYRILTPFTDPAAALASEEDAVWGLEGNQLSRTGYRRGDVESALAGSAHVVHETFQTQRVEHAFLEPESTLAVPTPDGGLHVYSGGQGIWDDRDQIASVLGVDKKHVTVELVSNGGAFGGKEDLSNQAHAALAAYLTNRPVKCTLTREQSFRMHAKRHPITIEVWAGCDEDGNLTALRASLLGDSGPYASVGMKVLERAAGHISGPYAVPNIDVEAVAVRTNNPVCGAFRGFGANQAQFAMEGIMDRLAEKVGVSGWEMRIRNVVKPGDVWGPGQVMDEGCVGARLCLETILPFYDRARSEGKAVGLGFGLKNSGLGNGFREVSKAVVRFDGHGEAEVRHGWTEMGQGVHTVALQVTADQLGIPPERIRVVVDTTRELGFGQTTGSRGTVMTAGSVAAACRSADGGGREPGVDYEGTYVIDWTDSLDSAKPNPKIHSTFSYAAQLIIADRDSGVVQKVVAVHDVGRVVNRMLCEGQVEGAVHMGLGYALTEEFPTDEGGFPVHRTLRGLGILRPKDIPAIQVILVEAPQPDSPFGVKGVGEIGLVPTAGAVAAAYHDLDGIWRNRLPINRHQPLQLGTTEEADL